METSWKLHIFPIYFPSIGSRGVFLGHQEQWPADGSAQHQIRLLDPRSYRGFWGGPGFCQEDSIQGVFYRIHYLVGGLVAMNFIFPFIDIRLLIIPIDFPIFQRGGPTTNQIMIHSFFFRDLFWLFNIWIKIWCVHSHDRLRPGWWSRPHPRTSAKDPELWKRRCPTFATRCGPLLSCSNVCKMCNTITVIRTKLIALRMSHSLSYSFTTWKYWLRMITKSLDSLRIWQCSEASNAIRNLPAALVGSWAWKWARLST